MSDRAYAKAQAQQKTLIGLSPRNSLLQRTCACGQHTNGGECSTCRSEQSTLLRAQRAFGPPSAAVAVPPIVHEVLRSPGQPIDPATRAFMKPRFGHDFSGVHVHTDAKACESARAVNALAYTVGEHVVFGAGHYAPFGEAGQRLLAHELAHTLQQGVAAEQVTMGDLRVGQQNDPFEQEAERASTSVQSARVGVSSEKPATASLRPDGHPTLHRQPRTRPEVSPPRTPVFEGDFPPKEEGGQQAPTPAQPGVTTPIPAESECKSPSNVALPCSPQGVSNEVFLKKGAPQEALGWTRPLKSQKIPPPEALTKPIGKGKQVVLQQTKATPVSCESFFTKAGPSFWRLVSIDDVKDKKQQREFAEKCGSSYLGNRYRKEYRITPDGEKKIREMELEHCTDYKYAFDISIGCYAAVVNDLAKRKTVFPSHEDALDAVTKRAGRKPDTWPTDGMKYYLELVEKSAERDTKKWHDAVDPKGFDPFKEVAPDRKGVCSSQFPTEINEKSYPEVGNHLTPDVIK